jgi:hypothetical protein
VPCEPDLELARLRWRISEWADYAAKPAWGRTEVAKAGSDCLNAEDAEEPQKPQKGANPPMGFFRVFCGISASSALKDRR